MCLIVMLIRVKGRNIR